MTSEFQVGQVIPQLKGQTSDITNPKATQNSYEYKDTGLILSVTPHIRSGNLVVLDINQKTEDVLTAMTATTPVTAKREIKTSVIVGNGKTVILGGLLKETEKTLKNRVPGLSYIPLLGSLFTKTSKQKGKDRFHGLLDALYHQQRLKRAEIHRRDRRFAGSRNVAGGNDPSASHR
jgi:general secretion pathway protein D